MAGIPDQRHGAGASAARMGQQQLDAERARQHARARWALPAAAVGGLVLAVLLGLPWWLGLVLVLVVVGAVARRVYRPVGNSWTIGAAGERRTAQLLIPLQRDGWTALHDRAVPGSRANVDHLLIGPAGVLMVDTKNWQSSKSTLRIDGGRLFYGKYDQSKTLRTAAWEAEQTSRALGVPVRALVAVHGASVPGGVVMLENVTVVPAKRVRHIVRNLAPVPGFDPARVQQLADHAARVLPPHGG
ncbi:NERD domain-containing protein [Streptomyces kaniharaensis]|uniref:NERD domain-containing protein n=1 Tax=Streptomyces kaniharaensis TaxID=212423 RepID=A0A6N7L1R8_9ACTN|nr:nuclease-related domain-containing protein [Streptomyces kaniharaensis]MQS17936.1 NERD domain-containing protein [Streptomyces kaniharaensis]